MNMNKKSPFIRRYHQSLALRQAYLTVAIALIMGFFIALLLLMFEYRSEQQRIEGRLDRVIESTSAAAAESLWILSIDLANGVSEGLVSQPLIVEASIETLTGTLLSRRSRTDSTPAWLNNFSFIFGSERVVVIPLFHKEDRIGQLNLKIDPLPVRQEFLYRALMILLSELVKALILAAALLVLFYTTLARPVRRYADWVARINPADPEGWQQPPPKRQQRDELTTLGNSVFQRFVQARAYFMELEQTRTALKALNQDLEDRVQARTKELNLALAHAEHLATTDVLTGIPNRRSFMEQAEKRHAEWLRNKSPYAVLMLDLDKFKQINDEHGHLAGDLVLKSVAISLSEHTRCEDIIGRLGGEEFGVILVGIAEANAVILAERIRNELEKLPIEFEGHSISVTSSFGLVPAELLQDNFDDVLKNADKMMYQAKNKGRNQVCLYRG
ncbi:MAG: diguanylate cyclase (GGDEF)-like protein [Oleispira sp.]|jgi:diguanylate cyclase (GGDEF)-like protein